jgi:hypothetical protein
VAVPFATGCHRVGPKYSIRGSEPNNRDRHGSDHAAALAPGCGGGSTVDVVHTRARAYQIAPDLATELPAEVRSTPTPESAAVQAKPNIRHLHVAALGKHGISASASSYYEDGQRPVNGLFGDGLAGEENAVYCFVAESETR